MNNCSRLAAWVLVGTPTALAQTPLLDVTGSEVGGQYGMSSVALDDVDGDGVPDLAIGAPTAGAGGEVYVTSGADGTIIRTLSAPAQTQLPDGETLYGFSLCALGDQDGDGIREIAIGIPGQQLFFGERNGAVQIVSGATGTPLVLALGVNAGSAFGADVASAGDMDGDSLDDLWISAPNAVSLGERSGLVTLYSFANAAYLRTLGGPGVGSGFGDSIAVLPDIDGDGQNDLAVTSPGDSGPAGPGTGSVAAFSGNTGALLYRVYGANFGEFFGSSVASVPDVNGDGMADVAIGSRNGTAGAANGRVALVSGTDGAVIRDITGQNAFPDFGQSVAGIGDLDGDGAGEVIVGQPSFGGGPTAIGAVHVISGGTGQAIFELTGNEPSARLGGHVANLGDMDGDGVQDFAASSLVRNGLFNGALSVYLGADAPILRQCANAVPNSTGQVSVMGFEGTANVTFNRATLRTDRLPAGVFGIYLGSRVYQNIPIPGGSSGQLCLGGALGRFSGVQQASTSGSFSQGIDLFALPTTNAFVAAVPGETWHFQAWHRDVPTGATQGVNFSDSIGILMR